MKNNLKRKISLAIVFSLFFPFFSCSNEKAKQQNNLSDDSENERIEVIYGDGYWQYGKDGPKVYEISGADEFRQKLAFYDYKIHSYPYLGKPEHPKIFNLDADIGSIIYTINEYLLEYNIYSEKLMFNILDVLLDNIGEKDFPQISVYYTDIDYGYFSFYYYADPNKIHIFYNKAEGIDTFFSKQFQLDNDDLTFSNNDYDIIGMEKMIALCKIYNQILEGKKLIQIF